MAGPFCAHDRVVQSRSPEAVALPYRTCWSVCCMVPSFEGKRHVAGEVLGASWRTILAPGLNRCIPTRVLVSLCLGSWGGVLKAGDMKYTMLRALCC